MTPRNSRRPMWRTRVLMILAVAAAVGLSVGWSSPAVAASPSDLSKIETSLHWIPADAALYSSMLRNREQFEAILKSRAFAKVKDMPVVKMGLAMYEAQSADPNNPAAKAKMTLTNPQVQDLLALLGDMVSDEIFLYADADVPKALTLTQQIAGAMRYGPMVVQLQGNGDVDAERIQAMLALAVLSENLDAVKVPGMVMGFKLKDPTRATNNLAKFEMLAGMALTQAPPQFANALKRTKVGDHEYLVLTISGDMIPWDEVPLDELRELETEKGSVDKLVEKLKKEKLVVAAGLRDNYLLLALGSSTDVLARLGKGESLASRPEFAPLAKHAGERVVAVEYVSEAFMDAAQSADRDIDEAVAVLGEVLPSTKLSEAEQQQILKDVKGLAGDVKKMMPTPGAVSGVSYLTDGGMESFVYNWTKRNDLDGSRPLSMLSHVGGTPLLAVVGRQQKGTIEEYDRLVSWFGVGYGYFEKYALPQMEESEREKAKKAIELFRPIVARWNKTNRELLFPALDGQIGLVVDGKLTSKQFLSTVPATEQAMPMAEPALLLGVRDEEMMRKALDEYWETIKEAVHAAGQLDPEASGFTLPEPKTIKTDQGVVYAFLPPADCPVDKQVAPNVAVSKDLCVFSATQAHSARLLASTPLTAGGVLADPERARAGAGVFDMAGLLKTATPWIDLATESIVRENMSEDAAKAQLPAIRDQVHTAIDVLSTIRGVTSETYLEDGVIVGHTRVEIRDLP